MTRLALCGGTYSNPCALRAFAADARARGADRLWCLGDFGAYGAEPEAIWPLLTGNGIECIAGNYELAIGRGDPDCGCGYADDNAFAAIAYDYTLRHTSAEFAAWMRTLATEHRETVDGVTLHLVHGSPLAVNDFWWESLPDDAHQMRIEASGAGVICCTHSGLPWTRHFPDGAGGEQAAGPAAGRDTLVVNVGVLGRPANDGGQHVWYALLDCVDGHATAELVALDYDWRAHTASMRNAGLPEAFTQAVETGWWTTCLEIVPPVERSRGRYQLYTSAMPFFADADVSWAAAPEIPDNGLPVLPLFGSALFPPRLWLYTNFHCNLACRPHWTVRRPGSTTPTGGRGPGSWAKAMDGLDAEQEGAVASVGLHAEHEEVRLRHPECLHPVRRLSQAVRRAVARCGQQRRRQVHRCGGGVALVHLELPVQRRVTQEAGQPDDAVDDDLLDVAGVRPESDHHTVVRTVFWGAERVNHHGGAHLDTGHRAGPQPLGYLDQLLALLQGVAGNLPPVRVRGPYRPHDVRPGALDHQLSEITRHGLG